MAKFLFFSQAKDITGLDECEISIPKNTDINGLWQLLIDKFPDLAQCEKSSRIAINMEYATEASSANDSSEIAIIPPVAGG